MAEALAVFGAIGTAIDLAGVTYKIISTGSDIYKNGRENLPLNESRDKATRDLEELSANLVAQYKAVSSDSLSEDDQKKMELCEACNAIALELMEALQEVKVRGDKGRKRESLAIALKSIWKEDRIEGKRKQLEEYRSALVTRYLIESSVEQKVAAARHSQQLQEINQTLQTVGGTQQQHHEKESASLGLLVNSFHQLSARLEETTLRAPSPANVGRRSRSPRSFVSDDGYTLVGKESPSLGRSIHEIIDAGDRASLQDLLFDNAAEVLSRDAKRRTPLHTAVANGNSRIVTDLLKAGAMIDALDQDMSTPLHYAARISFPQIVRQLVAAGADRSSEDAIEQRPIDLATDFPEVRWILIYGHDLEARDEKRNTAILHFTKLGDKATVKSLLTQGANVNTKGEQGSAPLIEASWRNDTGMVELLLRHQANVNETDGRGDTALGKICQLDDDSGDDLIFNMLLETKADISIKNEHNFNAAFEAAGHNNFRKLEVLIELGSNLELQSWEGHTPLTLATNLGYTRIVDLLLSKGHVKVDGLTKGLHTPMSLACREGRIEIVRLLYRHNANVNSTNEKRKYSLLSIACMHRKAEVVRELLKQPNVRFNQANTDGWTPLHESTYRGDCVTTQLLLQAGADVNLQNDLECTPLHLAAQGDFGDVAQILIEHGAYLEEVCGAGRTPLLDAAWYGRLAAARVLLKHGANVKTKNRKKQYTPLCSAAMRGHTGVVELLLNNRASPHEFNTDGWTPLAEAALWGFTEIARLLLDKGADPLCKDKTGKTPMFRAVEKENIDIVKLMCTYLP